MRLSAVFRVVLMVRTDLESYLNLPKPTKFHTTVGFIMRAYKKVGFGRLRYLSLHLHYNPALEDMSISQNSRPSKTRHADDAMLFYSHLKRNRATVCQFDGSGFRAS